MAVYLPLPIQQALETQCPIVDYTCPITNVGDPVVVPTLDDTQQGVVTGAFDTPVVDVMSPVAKSQHSEVISPIVAEEIEFLRQRVQNLEYHLQRVINDLYVPVAPTPVAPVESQASAVSSQPVAVGQPSSVGYQPVYMNMPLQQ